MPLTEKLKVEKADGIGTLILNQPNKRNAISFEMWRDLPAAMAELEDDPDVRVMVGIEHPKYAHAVIVAGAVRDALAADFAA